MTDEALIEELARVIGQQIEGPAEDMDGPWYGKPLWASYTNEARAILPIIRRREIKAGEKVKEAAHKAVIYAPKKRGNSHAAAILDADDAVRALDVAAIIGGEHD